MIVSWKEVIEPILGDLEIVRFWDLAATKPLKPSHDPDWTAGALVGVTRGEQQGVVRGEWYTLHVERFRETPSSTDRKMFERHLKDDELCRRMIPVRAEQEGGSAGKRDMDHVARTMFLGVDFEGKQPNGSKGERAKPTSRAAEARHWHLAEGAWNEDYLREFELFPDGDHDDQVDATSGAQRFLAERVMMTGVSAETVPMENSWGVVN